MHFSRLAFLALPLLALAQDGVNSCAASSYQLCCNSVSSANALSTTQKTVLGFFGFNLDNVQGQFGFVCNPITGAAAYKGGAASFGTAGCNAQTLCCQDSEANGFIGAGCNPIIGNI